MSCPSAEKLGAHARGLTATVEAPDLDTHVASCDTCRAVLRAAALVSERGFSPGESIGRYRVEAILGRGGMGVVLRAFDPELGRNVALKLLRPGPVQIARGHVRSPVLQGTGGAHRVELLLAEARAMARLTHPNVVPVLDVGTFGDEAFLAMEYVEGSTLRDWLREAPRSTREILDAFVQAGRGLHAAHEAGLVHRDFKPDNVLVGRDGRVRVTDFGIARQVEAEDAPPSSSAAAPRAGTRGRLFGTPRYMAPEQLDGAVADARTDVFSFCVSLYEAVAGVHPFFDDPKAVPIERLREARTRTRPAALPRWLARVLARGLAAARGDRYAGMEPLLGALVAIPRRRRAVAVGLVAGMAMIALGGAALRVRRVDSRLCAAGPARLATVWNDARKESISAAFGGSNKSYATVAFRTVTGAVDDYGRAWASQYADACTATQVRGDQSQAVLDLRMQCLGERLRGIDAFAEVLSHADSDAVAAVYTSPVALEPLDRCANPQELTSEMRPPSDPARAATVVALQAELAKARAQRMTKQRDRLANAERLAADADAAGYAPLEAEVHLLEGRLLMDERRFEDAERALLRAAARAESGHADGIKASAWIELSQVATRQGQFARAHQHAAYAAAVVERAGGRADLTAALAAAEGWAYFHGGDYAKARSELERARELYEHAVDDPRELVRVMHHLGATAVEARDLAAASAILERALPLAERALGPSNPEVAKLLEELGYVARDRDDVDGALGSFTRALAITDAVDGPGAPSGRVSRSAIGLCDLDLGRFDEAEVIFRTLAAEDDRALPAGSAERRQALTNLGLVEVGLWRPREAISLLRRALDIVLANFAPTSDIAMRTRTDLAQALRVAGELREAEAMARAAVDAQKSAKDAWGEAPRTLGEILLSAGRPAEALPYLESALAIDEADGGPEHSALVPVLLALGEALRLTGEPARALVVFERALTLADRKPRRSWLRGAARVRLAHVLGDLHRDPERARTLVAEAQPFFAADGGAAHALR